MSSMKMVFVVAMSKWAENSLIRFTEVDDETQANVKFKFVGGDHGDGYNFDGPGNVLAHAFFPNQNRAGAVHFDLSEKWTLNNWGSPIQIDLFNVVIHELGHALGINHSSQEDSVMYAWYKPENSKLSEDDLLAIRQLYGVRLEHKFGPISPATRGTTSRTTTERFTTRRYNKTQFKRLFIHNSKVSITI